MPDRFESQSSLAFGDEAGPVDTPVPDVTGTGLCAPATAPLVPPAPTASQTEGPDLIDFGDEPEAATAAADVPPNVCAGPSRDAPALLPASESGSPAASGTVVTNGMDLSPGVEAVDDLAQAVQEQLQVDTKKPDNPFV